ncbi:MAG: glycosyltransferase [Lachnospiraceae bacterium]|nr:glycosyltransferase [Lachnospiraceae bacterium]
MLNILCGIVTYNPDIDLLQENINAIIKQVNLVYIFDNGSKNINDIEKLLENMENIIICRGEENYGVAYALKYLTDYASCEEYDWILTLDQDSVVKDGLIKEYLKYTQDEKIGGLTCLMVDRKTNELECICNTKKEEEITGCITAGFFLKIEAYRMTSGYDVKLFIDSVDYDICNELRERGYKIIRIPFLGVIHELGDSKIVCFLGKKIVIYNHSGMRKYYIFRNSIYEAKKYKEFYSLRKEIYYRIKDIFKIWLWENRKMYKTIKAIQGIVDGLKMKVDK